ncbi:Putative N-acetyl-LL-diaminopimelate aminotransferase [Paraliobacillus sp. PM-2]|uniref:aminotransferase n=1 Tax=Paraliobacillus sp. PM-2 TaxID=1462524 RepID=UPI00061B8B9E|nr:aminotransferase [Paraliobacillus sp. PM-2]CQR46006.1 Putative N-acetyl-LL-diaminopimelate aminotransferase [Paraliobacillus sp. PM-2]
MRTQDKTFVADHVNELKPSGIRRFFDLAAKMENVISLGVGEPDFVTPWNVIEASYHSLEQGYTSYTANAGLLELRQEISKFLHKNYQLEYNPESQVLVTVGASQAIDVTLRAIINPGDEVIVVEPSFVAYVPAVRLAGGKPVTVEATQENQFKVQANQIEASITPKTKAIMICSPNNPTGAVLSKEELDAIAGVVKKYDLLVLSDEIYADLTYDEEFTSFASIDGMAERTILISGFSKAFAMTGWRLGYAAGPKEILQAMTKIHQYTIMCAPTMAQHGALEALRNGMDNVKEMRVSYRQRRNFVVKALQDMGLDCHLPGGAFYVFPSIENTGLTSAEFAEELLQEQQVAVVPGDVFGNSGSGYIRCSYASSMKQLDQAMKRMNQFMRTK